MGQSEQMDRMRERLQGWKQKAAFQRLRPAQPVRFGAAGGLLLLLAIAVPILMVWGARPDTVELDPIVVQLYSERGMEPPPEEKQTPASSLPEDWRQRFQPRLKEYPVEDLTPKADPQYKRVNRHEYLPRVLESAPRKKLRVREHRPAPDSLHIHDKDLVLAGRGYEIGRFQPQPGLGLQLNTLPLPEAERVPLSELPGYGKRSAGPEAGSAINRMIFHSRATGIPPQLTLEPPMKPEAPSPEREEAAGQAERLPRTRLVPDVNDESLLLLNPGPEKPVDLLNGHPAINRHRLEQWEQGGK